MARRLRLMPEIRKLLADGLEHPHHELVVLLAPHIPPENAVWEFDQELVRRARKFAKEGHTLTPQPMSLSDKIYAGRSLLVREHARYLKGVERTPGRPQGWRLPHE